MPAGPDASSVPSPATATSASPSTLAATTASPVAPSASVVAGVSNPSAPSPASGRAVAFTDIAGITGEQAIRQEAQLGILEGTSGAFRPLAPITRGEYVRWLVRANNAYLTDPAQRIRLAEPGNHQRFVDLPSADPNFPYIQGMADAGLLVGIDARHFVPTRDLTREELVAIIAGREHTGAPDVMPKTAAELPQQGLSDRGQISKPYWAAFVNDRHCYGHMCDNLGRVYGAIKVFHPQAKATREDAAIAVQNVMDVTASDALARLGQKP